MGEATGARALIGVQAALRAGAGAVEALSTVPTGALARAAAAARMGRPLGEIADEVEVEAAGHLLLRALAVAERAGVGERAGVDQALAAVREAADTDRLLRVKTAQARGTARLLAAIPIAGWILIVGLDPAAVRFYATPSGATTGLLAVTAMLLGRVWTRRIVDRAADAAASVDPLRRPLDGVDTRGPWLRSLAIGLPAAAVVAVAWDPVAGLVAGTALGGVGGRRPRTAAIDLSGGGTAEAVELVALGLESGLALPEAVGLVAEVGPPAARGDLSVAHRRLSSGWTPLQAFERTRLSDVGAVLAVIDRWGAPAGPPLRGLARDLRAERLTAAEEAAERTQLLLVFPTTLLTLPAFALAVVPPLVWLGFAN